MDIKSYKQKKTRGLSVRQVIESALDDLEQLDSIVIVAKYDNNNIATGYSGDNNAELAGLCEFVKSELIELIADE
ncbi:phosphoribosylaminoimidazole carboxylase catalytic subunit [Sporosarcina newyorkensis 2681]|uniref:Phosphoribosylaminoimidazole carboxylase catalytic subunit n=1 Tax=Sporosarcina newyorkensis 2681 TaxID=1027292 RepID=F9DX40_9BACL|nr:hypothetical protein [Sporosarcina newyorkensis]EGQ21088.1 phosphoribosylaminoimidazole carboxylase catalytic subunit [Sporosarcina newyorkensis 2681]